MSPEQLVEVRKKVMEDVVYALRQLFDYDRILLEIDSSERSITHWLGVYLSDRNPSPLNVDCEYNRYGNASKPKNLGHLAEQMQDVIDSIMELKGKKFANVSPDIAVHRRTLPINVLVLEAKKSKNIEPWAVDRMKLRMYTGDFNGEGQRLDYTFGLFVVFRHNEQITSISQMCELLEWYEDGKLHPDHTHVLRGMLPAD